MTIPFNDLTALLTRFDRDLCDAGDLTAFTLDELHTIIHHANTHTHRFIANAEYKRRLEGSLE